MAKKRNFGMFALRLAIGVFFIFEGLEKVSWVLNSEPLVTILHRWAASGAPLSRWYVEQVAIPGAPLFARLVFLGEIAAGIAFLSGRHIRIAAIVTFLIVLQIHFAHSTLFHYSFLSQGDGLPVLGCLLALALTESSERGFR